MLKIPEQLNKCGTETINRGKMDNWWACIESSDALKKFEWMSWIKNNRNTVKEMEKSKWKEKIEEEMWRMEADLWTVISTFAGSSVNPAFPTAAIVPFNFSHYLLCSQTNKLINLLIVQTFQLHSSWIYDCLVNGWWVLCRKHHPNGTTVNTRDRKQTDMFDTLFFRFNFKLFRLKQANNEGEMANYHKNEQHCWVFG